MKIFDFTGGIKGRHIDEAHRVNRVDGTPDACDLQIDRYEYQCIPGREKGRTFDILSASDYGVPAICYCTGYHWDDGRKVWDWAYTASIDYARELAGAPVIEAEYVVESCGVFGATGTDNYAPTDAPEHAWHAPAAPYRGRGILIEANMQNPNTDFSVKPARKAPKRAAVKRKPAGIGGSIWEV